MSLEFRSDDYTVCVHAPVTLSARELLSADSLRFLGYLCSKFEDRRRMLLSRRAHRSAEYDAGLVPHFLPPSLATTSSWMCAPIPPEVNDRRVEITGPVDRKMVINGLNSGANVYMADFEDSTSPTWNNLIDGQVNLRDAVHQQIAFIDTKTAKRYVLQDHTAVLFVRPRGWHLDEAHLLVNGNAASASIFDFALYLFHNHAALVQKNSRPYFYLPKMESHLEARLWNDIFIAAQQYLGLPLGTIRATALLETINAAFEMEEILYELRDHSLGLNCGRWDYLFSYIKNFKMHQDKIAPDRTHLTMTIPLMDAYVKVCFFTLCTLPTILDSLSDHFHPAINLHLSQTRNLRHGWNVSGSSYQR
jgi:malate synthase